MRFGIVHRTRYEYASPVRDSFNEVRLQPFSNEQQTVDSFELRIDPTARVREYHDFYSNRVHNFDIVEPHSQLLVESRLQVVTHPAPSLALDARPVALNRLKEPLKADRCYDFMQESRYVDTSPETWRLAVDATQGESDLWQCALRVMHFVHSHLAYESQSTNVHTHMQDVLKQRRGVCQDFAHVMLGLCRTLRLPTLYVSGYLATETASATHAWVEVFVPGHGWQALDPTHNRIPDEQYVKIGVGRDYADVAPVRGTYRGTAGRSMSVDVQIQRLD